MKLSREIFPAFQCDKAVLIENESDALAL